MTPPANANHPYLRAVQFRDPTFIKVRRQVALLRLPYAEGKMRDLLEDTVRVYTDLLDEQSKAVHCKGRPSLEGTPRLSSDRPLPHRNP